MRSHPPTPRSPHRSTPALRTALGAGAALASAVTLAACGATSAARGTSSAGPVGATRPAAALATARTDTVRAGSARITVAESVRSTAGGGTRAIRTEGVTALAGGGSARGRFTVTSAGRSIEMRMIGTTLYEQLPDSPLTGELSGGKPWIKVNTAEPARTMDLTSSHVPDAAQQLGYLAGAQRVTEVGGATVDGVRTTRYRAMVVPPRTGRSAAQHPSAVPVDVWVDAQHRVRQEELVMTPSGPTAAGKPVTVTLTMRLSDFGTAVRVTPPPAGQVTEATAATTR